MTKFKKRKEEQLQTQNGSTEFAGQSSTNAQNIRNNNSMAERFGKIFKKKKKTTTITTRSCDENALPPSPSSSSSDNDDNRMSDDALDRLDNLECDEEMSPIDDEMSGPRGRAQRKQKNPIKNRNNEIACATHVLDTDLWKQRKTCCGMFYENKKLGAILLETSQYSMDSCSVHAKKLPLIISNISSSIITTKKDELMKLPTAIKSLPPKKQHFLRQCIIEAAPPSAIAAQMPIEQSAPIDYSKSTASDSTRILNHSLHKIRNEAGKVSKKTPKKKLAELNAAKNLIKLCTSNKLAKAAQDSTMIAPSAGGNENKYREQNGANEHNENKNITNTVCLPVAAAAEPIATPKYSDNSSDSGYDETLHDATQLNQIAKIGGASRPIILSNGVKLHVKPENLVLAANLAGVSQTAIQTTQVSVTDS